MELIQEKDGMGGGGGVSEVRYVARNMHMVLLSFVLLWADDGVLMDSCVMIIHILQGCFTGIRAIVRLPWCRLSDPEGYG